MMAERRSRRGLADAGATMLRATESRRRRSPPRRPAARSPRDRCRASTHDVPRDTGPFDITVVSQYLGGSPAGAIEYVGYHVKAVGASGESVQSQEHYFRPDGEAPQRVGGGVGLDVQQP